MCYGSSGIRVERVLYLSFSAAVRISGPCKQEIQTEALNDKWQLPANSAKSLCYGIINMCCFTSFFSHRLMSIAVKHFFICTPKVTKRTTMFIKNRNSFPSYAPNTFASITYIIGNYLTSTSRYAKPNVYYFF